MQIARHMSALVSALALFSAWAAEHSSFTSTDVMDTGYWSGSFSVGLGGGTPELHTYYVCTGVFTVYGSEE